MRITIVAVGRLKQGPERQLAERYLERAAKGGRTIGFRAVEIVEVDDSRAREAERRMLEESIAIANVIPPGASVVLLDERGDALDSPTFAQTLGRWRDEGRAHCVFVVGGPDGLAPGLRDKATLRLALGVSNEWSPDGCETALAAFFDRFLFRKGVAPVGQRGLRRLLEKARAGDACRPAFPDKITLAEVDQAHAEAMALPVTNGAQKAMWDIQIELRHEKIQPSDRRTMKAYKAARAYAYLCGARGVIASDGVTVLDGVRAEHLEILRHVLWAAPEQAKKCATVVMKHSNPTGSRVTELLTQADDKVDSLTGLRGEQLKHQAAVVVAALEGVAGQLDALPPDPRVSAALAYVRGQVDTVRPQVLGMAPAEG